MGVAPYHPLIPKDWIKLEQLINEIFGILNADTTLSDVVLTTSDLQVEVDAVSDIAVANASNIVWMESDADTVKSDIVIMKSDVTTNASDIAVLAAEPDCPVYKYISVTAQAPGDLHLSDVTNWNISKALIKHIHLDTSSTNWDLWLLQNDNGYAIDDAAVPALRIINAASGEANISMDYPYQDEDASAEIHLYYVDNGGANTADIIIKAYELS